MKVELAPPNDFVEFWQTYRRRCVERVPQICAIAAKWTFEDLIPGLSDFDTRFIVRDPMNIDDWHVMSRAVGEVHTGMAREFPRWHRILEHLPGLNYTVSEITSPNHYYPEFKQWTFYDGDPQVLDRINCHLETLLWSQRDEYYHLKKVATFYGPYMRGIDPAINLGPFESKYPLHSRYMHYFTPPVQAMVSLKRKQTVRGKFDSLHLAREAFPNPRVIDRIFDTIERHYEIPSEYEEPRLSEIERELEQYLSDAWGSLGECLTLVTPCVSDDRDTVQSKVVNIASDPRASFLEGTRFCRLMEGRLRFYAADVHNFDTDWLINNELNRIVPNFFVIPLKAYAVIRYGTELDPLEVLERIRGRLVDSDAIEAVKRLVSLVSECQSIGASFGSKKELAIKVADLFRPMLELLVQIGEDLLDDCPANA
jgi:hypothetical protein